MKRLLMGFVLLATTLVGVGTPSAEIGAEQSEAPAGVTRDVSRRLGNGHTNACIVLDNGQVRCWGGLYGIGVPGSRTVADETPDSGRTVNVDVGRTVMAVDGGQG